MPSDHFKTRDDDIAIIGLSGLFAGSPSKDALWQNIINKQDAVAEAPDTWAVPWYDPDSSGEGLDSARISTRKVGLLGELATFDPLAFGIPPKGVEGDPAHFIALQLAGDALKDAGYDTQPFDRARTGVIVGHGSNPNRGDMLGMQYGFFIDQALELVVRLLPRVDEPAKSQLRTALKRSLPQLEVEMAPTLISNVISGRISNRLDLMGPSYLVDSACSSSLIALDLGIRDLLSGRCEMVLVGGVQASMPAQIYMLFEQIGALAKTDIRPFDASANGTLLGEGAGFAVIKRLADAERDDDRIYAVIEGVGVASDGKAMGLLAPRVDGEALAVQRAYEQARVAPETVTLIEAHGTGIPLGDRTEIESLSRVFGKRSGQVPRCALGSVKSMIGHCIPAAGMASLIKTALALHYRTLPPTLCETVNPDLGLEATPFYINNEPRPWVHDRSAPRRAGINAFGFGGINTHAILREHRRFDIASCPAIGRWLVRDAPGSPSSPGPCAGEADVAQAAGAAVWRDWPYELILLAAATRSELLTSIRALHDDLAQSSDLTLSAVAHRCWLARRPGDARLAVVAQSGADLMAKLAMVLERLPTLNEPAIASRQGIYYTDQPRREGDTVFMFSSEGAQYQNMLADLALYFPKVRSWFDYLDQIFPREPRPSACIFPPPTCLDTEVAGKLAAALFEGDLATECIAFASHALYEVVSDLGIRCDAMVGHSAGEHVALKASGMARTRSMDRMLEELRKLNTLYAAMEEADELASGCILSVGAIGIDKIRALLRELGDAVYLVADNCPNQMLLFVTSGNPALPQEIMSRIGAEQGIAMQLPLTRAYHTPLFAAGAAALRDFYEREIEIGPGHVPVFSCSTTEPYPTNRETFFDVAANQWQLPVRFRETLERLYARGARVFVELGTGNSLSAFAENTLNGKGVLVVPANQPGRPALQQFLLMLAQLFVNKIDMDLRPMFASRGKSTAVADSDAQGASKPEARLQIHGDLPKLALADEAADRLRPSLIAAAPEPRPAASGMQPPLARVPAEAADTEAIAAHFRLMQQFLDNQARVSDSVFRHLHSARPDEDGR